MPYSPFQDVTPSNEGQATPVHHDKDPHNSKMLLSGLIRRHSDAINGYMGRIHAGESLNDIEHHDFQKKLRQKGEAIDMFNKLEEEHANLKARDEEMAGEHEQSETRARIQENLNKFRQRQSVGGE